MFNFVVIGRATCSCTTDKPKKKTKEFDQKIQDTLRSK